MRTLVFATLCATLFSCLARAEPWEALPRGSGRLVLVGGGGTPESARRRCLAGTSGKVLVVTAPIKDPRQSEADWNAAHDITWREWKDGLAEIFRKAGASPVEFIAESDTAAARRQLDAAEALWFTGGDQTNITKAYPPRLDPSDADPDRAAGHALFDAMRARHKAGMNVCGTSAGAAMAGDLMFTGEYERGKPVLAAGMGFLPGVTVDSHFTQRLRLLRLLPAMRDHVGEVGIGINEGSAVEFDGGRVTVLTGSAQFLRITGTGERDYRSLDMIQGQSFRLPDGILIEPARSAVVAAPVAPVAPAPAAKSLPEASSRLLELLSGFRERRSASGG